MAIESHGNSKNERGSWAVLCTAAAQPMVEGPEPLICGSAPRVRRTVQNKHALRALRTRVVLVLLPIVFMLSACAKRDAADPAQSKTGSGESIELTASENGLYHRESRLFARSKGAIRPLTPPGQRPA